MKAKYQATTEAGKGGNQEHTRRKQNSKLTYTKRGRGE